MTARVTMTITKKARPVSADHDPSPMVDAPPASGAITRARLRGHVALLHPGRVALALFLWAAWYAAYRLYYGLGGQAGMIGQPRNPTQFQHVNLIGGAVILAAALVPSSAVALWRHKRVRLATAAGGWIAFVGCCTHAITDEILRFLSLTGLHPTELSSQFWLSVNRQKADLQDVVLNEPWFFIEGSLWALLALAALPQSSRTWWLASAAVAGLMASSFGVLSGLGVVPTFRAG